ncbi:MAG: phage minor head protein [Candidatus Neomarinimicrobiota bacterium]
MQELGDLPIEEVFERFDEALAFFRARTPMPAEQFYALDAQARQKAFTVSNVGQMQMVQQVLDSLDSALETGQDLDSWKDEIGPALEAAWGGEVEHPAHRLATIYRTNVQTAFVHGRVRQMREPAVAGLRPFFLFDAIIDGWQTDICDARDGVLLPADDPWWLTNTPPLHFNCRAGIRSLRRAQAERRGGVNQPDPSIPEAGDGFGAAPSLDPRVQVAPWSPEVKGHPALEGARLRKEAEFLRDEEARQPGRRSAVAIGD